MIIKKLKEFVSFVPGMNQSRVENQFSDPAVIYYDQSAFESDFYFRNARREGEVAGHLKDLSFLREGDVVISNTKQVAAMIAKGNAGKVLPINFTKVEFLNGNLDKRYFLFLFNSFKEVQRQKERETQGMGAIQKIPLRSLGEIKIPYIVMPRQQLAGNAYVEMLEIQNKLKKYSELSEALTCTILEKTIQEVGK